MVKISYKGKTGFWTKWGGRRFSLVDSQNPEKRKEWACQHCGKVHPVTISGYKVIVQPIGEYIRICAVCFSANDCEPSMTLA